MGIFAKIRDLFRDVKDIDVDYDVVPKVRKIKRNDIKRYNKAIKNGNCCWAKTKGFTIK